jgi:hypothetical protein
MSEIKPTFESDSSEWVLADVVSLWATRNKKVIPLKQKILDRLLEDVVCSEDENVKVAIYVSKNKPGCLFIKLLPVEV